MSEWAERGEPHAHTCRPPPCMGKEEQGSESGV